MRVVIVGNFNERKAGANFYATVRKLMNGFIRNGHFVMPFSDRDVAREVARLGVGRVGDAGANKRLLDLCRNFRPDLVLLVHADIITNDTLRELKRLKPSPVLAVVNLDPLFEKVNPPRVRRFAEVADITFITTAGDTIREFATPTHRIAFIPNPVDRSIECMEGFARSDQAFDLICTIISEKGTPHRAAFMRGLQAEVPEARYEFCGLDSLPPLFGSDYFDAIGNARMGLNLSRGDDHYLYSSDRIAQYVGNGLLVFVARSSGYGDIFSDREFVFYDGLPDLAEKLRYFLTHDDERREIARAGHAKYHAIFNERVVARFMEEAAFGREISPDYAWPTTICGG